MPNVLIPLAKGYEELEAVTIIDLLRRAEITVITASLEQQTVVVASRGVRMVADTTLDKVIYDDFDMIILPGGLPGATHLNDDIRIHAILKRLHQSSKAVAAICAAPIVLANAGLLNGKRATCYPGILNTNDWPEITLSDDAVVIDDNILTSRGPGTAMDFALAIIEFLTNHTTRNEVEIGLVRSA
ncbi:MAG: DJ-1/PfpI family protein [Gammaproteobacteria bacterium]|nr:DJ-1/PfpI family protein [Gammaproteobacteria bacterium]